MTGDTLFVFMEDRPHKSRVALPETIGNTIGCVGVLLFLLIVGGIVGAIHDQPYYRSDIVVAHLSDETVRKATVQSIPVAATEGSLPELADAITDPDWAAALIKAQVAFTVPGGTRLAILGRDLSW